MKIYKDLFESAVKYANSFGLQEKIFFEEMENGLKIQQGDKMIVNKGGNRQQQYENILSTLIKIAIFHKK